MAYREMNWFTPTIRDYHLERAWIHWDRILLEHWHLRAIIESLGAVFPNYFEFCYTLVYAVAPLSLVILIVSGARSRIGRFWLAYLTATLASLCALSLLSFGSASRGIRGTRSSGNRDPHAPL